MPKKHIEEEEHGSSSERWLLTYSDLITLLMIFFIVMYSMSAVDNNKFTAMAEQLGIVLGGGSVIAVSDSGAGGLLKDIPYNPKVELDETQKKLEQYFEANGLGSMAKIYRDERGMVVSLNEGLLFSSGSADLDGSSRELLKKITGVIIGLPNYIRIEGYTDNVPIGSARYRSNWELASQRAINVAQILIDSGFSPERIATVSYGEYRPTAPNNNEINRKRNRKVDIVIMDQAKNKMEPKMKSDNSNSEAGTK
jgi:chemotaxis protein MotB